MGSVFRFFNTAKKKQMLNLWKTLAMRFVKHLIVTFSVGLPAKINNPVPASQVRFQQFRVIKRFCVEGSNKDSERGHSSNDLDFRIFYWPYV